MLMDIFDITVIGSGPSGLFGAFYAGLREMTCKVLETLPQAGGQLITLYPEKYIIDVPGFLKIQAKALAKNLYEQALSMGAVFRFNETAIDLERKDGVYILRTDRGEHFTKTVLITAGVGAIQPNKLGNQAIDRFEGRGVYYSVKSKEEFRGKRLLIIGGGDSALDWAYELATYAKHITLINRRDVFRAHEYTVKKVKELGIDIRLSHEIKEAQGESHIEQATIYNNKTGEEDTIPVDAILVFIGFKADLGPIKNWGMEIHGRQIKVNSRMETSLPGVYAAGDVAYKPESVKLNLLVVGFADVAIAVNSAKKFIEPSAPSYEHSTEIAERRLKIGLDV
ncbi:MAG: NAD(P)/FAD-dependent oxidoreductase [Nitrososphaerales archaeon]